MGLSAIKRFIPSFVWKEMRMLRILRTHSRVAELCERLAGDYYESGRGCCLSPLRPELVGQKIIWQYWAQGYDDVPAIVRECLDSVDKFRNGYELIRLTDKTVSEYVSLPSCAAGNSRAAGHAFYSDLLRTALLSVYGGVWLDATVMLSAQLRDRLMDNDFFMFQRDAAERNKHYWEGVYAYYYGWRKGFRVNVLNSVIYARAGSEVVGDICGILTEYWSGNKTVPDYFFFQILFDVLVKGRLRALNCTVISDCLPHYLQQYMNDSSFKLATREEILEMVEIHKLTYKHESND